MTVINYTLKALKNPFVLGGIALIILIGFYEFKISGLEGDIKDLEISISKLKLDLKTSEDNFDSARITNIQNDETIEQYEDDIQKFNQAYGNIIGNKDIVINRLKETIVEMKVPVIYPKEIIYEDCKFKIKTSEDFNASNITFTNISNIGR